MNCFRSFALFLTLAILACLVMFGIAKASTINQAEQGIRDAFLAIRSAEQAGANVTLLAVELEEAGSKMTDAQYELYVKNDSSSAELLINQSIALADQIKAEAAALENSAKSERADKFFWTGAFSYSGLCLLVAIGLIGYRFLTRWYVKRLLRMTPKVAD